MTDAVDLAHALRRLSDRLDKLEAVPPLFTAEEVGQLKRAADIIEESEAAAEGVAMGRMMGRILKWAFWLLGSAAIAISQWEKLIKFIGGGSP